MEKNKFKIGADMNKRMTCAAFATAFLMATPALAQTTAPPSGTTGQNTEQSAPNSAPGVQGHPDTRTGPATRAPGDSSSGGASSGESGVDLDKNTTRPSQDSTGVEGMPGNKSGPAQKSPSGSSGSGTQKY
jgi:hypothetical protein